MRLNGILLLFTLVASTAAFTSCGPSDTTPPADDNYTAQDALGNYDLTLDEDVTLRGTYNNRSQTENKVAISEVDQTSISVDAIDVSYDNNSGRFVLKINEGDSGTETFTIADSAVTAYDEDDYQTEFSAQATHLSRVVLTVPIAGAKTESIATGCESTQNQEFVLTFDKSGIDGVFTQTVKFATVAQVNSNVPYVSCVDWLAEAEHTLRSGGTDTSGLQMYVVNGGVDINSMQDLASASFSLHFSGKKTNMAAGSAIVPQGAIAKIRLRKSPRN